MIRGKVILN